MTEVMNGICQKDCDKERQSLLPKKKFQIIGYIFATMTALAYFFSLTFSQVSALKVNIYELYVCRYVILVIFVSLITFYNKQSLKINKPHIKYIVGIIIVDTIQSPCIYTAATFMPVGNMDAFHNAVFIFAASIYDIINKHIPRLRMFCALIVVAGIILLLQPWHTENVPNVGVPCEYLDGYKISDIINQTKAIFSTNQTEIQNELPQGWLYTHQKLIGYLLTTVAALGLTCRSNIARVVMKESSTSAILFWIYLAGAVISLIISVIWKFVKHEPVIDIKVGKYCILFSCLCVLFSAVTNCVSYYSVRYVHVSSLALTFVCTTVLLYISQRTFFKIFHPGYTNLLEVLGVVICILGIIVLSALETVQKYKTVSAKN